MFVVFGLFQLFILAGKPIRAAPALFIVVVAAASLLGAVVARFYSEPMNRFIRQRWAYRKTELAVSQKLESTDREARAKDSSPD
jgi:peptidoglycan/LPS O-acetylase OafA/YrhL